ncbi:hypothetical protein M427DRAFT_177195 [Gonapodya prolifera JEL478]|uniref:Uncharacterized protein n=1 Tax=Gonapodya prolifera (strain JEL478) TaxID=1344416 RepID=A0A139AQR8_GONPJ|nr:hypothetical protein M427DRAFT_177195 [Gonapodya prolifera JEL478]|eukprot:KXS18835.1 hypothetical protein M427DRAFT_177195 [Gonapodya prolifera JEL478]
MEALSKELFASEEALMTLEERTSVEAQELRLANEDLSKQLQALSVRERLASDISRKLEGRDSVSVEEYSRIKAQDEARWREEATRQANKMKSLKLQIAELESRLKESGNVGTRSPKSADKVSGSPQRIRESLAGSPRSSRNGEGSRHMSVDSRAEIDGLNQKIRALESALDHERSTLRIELANLKSINQKLVEEIHELRSASRGRELAEKNASAMNSPQLDVSAKARGLTSKSQIDKENVGPQGHGGVGVRQTKDRTTNTARAPHQRTSKLPKQDGEEPECNTQ